MIQQGQVFNLKARSAEGAPLWAYRYRVAGGGSARLQVGGFGSRAETHRALQNELARLVPGGRSASLTLGEWVEEYLKAHQRERVTVSKLRWPLGKATAELGQLRSDAGAAAGAESGGGAGGRRGACARTHRWARMARVGSAPTSTESR